MKEPTNKTRAFHVIMLALIQLQIRKCIGYYVFSRYSDQNIDILSDGEILVMSCDENSRESSKDMISRFTICVNSEICE